MIDRLRWHARAILAAVALSACYSYTPILATPHDVGMPVRLRLTDAGSLALAPLIGPQVETMDGHLLATSDSSLVLSATQAQDRRGVETPWRGERVTFPRTAVASVERRQLDRGRTWTVGGLAAAALAVIGRSIDLGSTSGGKPGGPGGKTQ